MQNLGQKLYREKLARLLAKTTLYDVVGMTWSAWAIQNGQEDIARRYMQFSAEVTDGSAGAPYVLYPWQLETLVNYAMAAPLRRDPRRRKLITQQFSTIFQLVKLVQRIEEADDKAFLQQRDVMYELHRLTQRQFEWQRGFSNMPRSYRALLMFGEGLAGAHFEARVGCTVPDFIEAGFYLFAGATNSATRIWRNHELPKGVTSDVRKKVLARISWTPDEAVREAKRLRSPRGHIGYEPSVLRRKPILLFGATGEDAMAPLPPLIMQRITSGLYFDIVDGGGAIWSEVGRRFEDYCLRYLKAMLTDYAVDPEYRYGPRARSFDSPDIIVSDSGGVRLLVECKAKRMPVEARFSGDPIGDAAAAYAEIAKGVFQIWRFLSHARRGLLDHAVAENCLGIVVTADPWLVMGQKLHPEVMAIANALADEKDPEISAEDRRRVPIVLVDDLEYILQHTDIPNFFDRLRSLSRDLTGWEWSLTHGLVAGSERPYPFADELRASLPRLFSVGV
ncbi:hypothetical protein BH10PSE12_BH10PSE12_08090 [soil metagenome]